MVFDRGVNADQRLDTHVQIKAASRWELAVPSGSYTVTLSVGDAAASSTNNIWIEGVNLFSYVPLAANRFLTRSITVNVTDGRLSMAIGSQTGGLSRVNYIEVAGGTTSPPTSPPPTSPPPTSPPPTSPPPTSPPPPVTTTTKVNFQPAAAATVAGYIVDSGSTYGARSQTYGWSIAHADAVFDRNVNADQRLDTLVSIKQGAVWELAVPTGNYAVTISVGDAAASSTNNVWVEGVNLFNYVSLSSNKFSSRSLTVSVTDGRLRLGIGGQAGGLTRINFVEVTKV